MSAITIFDYPNEEVAAFCEEQAVAIKELSTTLKRGIINIGVRLTKVKAMLGHGSFYDWLDFQFGMSKSTAANYMNASRAAEQYPRLVQADFEPTVMYLFTRTIPESAAVEIVEKGPMSSDEALVIIKESKGREWYEQISQVMEQEPGQAYTQATWAMNDPNLREHAAQFLRDNAGHFAVESDREPWEIQREAGMTLSERMNANRTVPATLQLHEGEDNHRICLWVDGAEPETLAYFPPPRSAGGRAWQYKIVETLRQQLGLRTADDIAEEL